LTAGLSQPVFDLLSGNPIFGVGTDCLVFDIAVDRGLYFSACVVSSLVGLVMIKEINPSARRFHEASIGRER